MERLVVHLARGDWRLCRPESSKPGGGNEDNCTGDEETGGSAARNRACPKDGAKRTALCTKRLAALPPAAPQAKPPFFNVRLPPARVGSDALFLHEGFLYRRFLFYFLVSPYFGALPLGHPFLFPNKKGSKKSAQGRHCVLAPASKATSPAPLQARS